MHERSGDRGQLAAGQRGDGNGPRRRSGLARLLRDLLLALAVLAVGGYITGSWLRNPNSQTVRRLATGVVAVLVGGAGVVLSFMRRRTDDDDDRLPGERDET